MTAFALAACRHMRCGLRSAALLPNLQAALPGAPAVAATVVT